MALQVGDKAPEILGLDQAGKEIRLSDFAGKKLASWRQGPGDPGARSGG